VDLILMLLLKVHLYIYLILQENLQQLNHIAPLHLVTIGVCIRKQQNNGSIFVKIQNGFEFDELHDVQIIDPENKASLYYNSSQSLWRDTTEALLVSDT
jgi:hypothetical protein